MGVLPYLRHPWLVSGGYGVWFAVFSGLEEISTGKFWKVACSLILALLVYLPLKRKLESV